LEIKKRRIDSFTVLVGEELSGAISFYEKNGFIFSKKIYLHGKTPSRVYIYNTKII
jgi:hypothetical protein